MTDVQVNRVNKEIIANSLPLQIRLRLAFHNLVETGADRSMSQPQRLLNIIREAKRQLDLTTSRLVGLEHNGEIRWRTPTYFLDGRFITLYPPFTFIQLWSVQEGLHRKRLFGESITTGSINGRSEGRATDIFFTAGEGEGSFQRMFSDEIATHQ